MMMESFEAAKPQRANKSKSSCCVPTCTKPGYMLENGNKVTFHSLPLKKEDLLKKWIVKIRRDVGEDFCITKHTRICSRHFTEADFLITKKGKKFLKGSAVPSVFSWKGPIKPRHSASRKFKEPDVTIQETVEDEVTDAADSIDGQCSPVQNELQQLRQQVKELTSDLQKEKERNIICQKEKQYIWQLYQTKEAEKEGAPYLDFCVETIKKSDDLVCFYTGFPTYNMFRQCLEYLNPGSEGINMMCSVNGNTLEARKPSSKRFLKIEDEFLLTLMRLRLGLFEQDLAVRFRISMTTVNRILNMWINFMYLRLGSLNIWPSKDTILKTMPDSFKEKFPATEWIIDAFEIQCERPSSLMLQSQSYSNYKSRNTVKGLVACTPSGQIGFISQLYTGNISDRELTIRSGFLKMPHNRGAMWLVDKGFQIQDLATPLGVTVNMPEFVGKNSQMDADAVFHTQQIASERIHVERIINKIKNFHIFDRPIQLSLFGKINQMWTVCALLTLWHRPIISA